jgi:hypothetical protein
MTNSRNIASGSPEDALRLLLVEDNDDDAVLIERAVTNAGYRPAVGRVQTAKEFTAALASGVWDVVISDYSLPRFSASAALACLHARGLDLPFIVVSGTIDEESAVTILKAGAHDFVTKQSLARLGPAIRRERLDARNRAERKDAQRDLQVQRDFLRLVIDANPNLIFVKDPVGGFTLANRAAAELYGTTVEELIGRSPDLARNAHEAAHSMIADREVLETRKSRFDASEPIVDARTGELRWFEMRRAPLIMPDGTAQVLGIGTDQTERRAAEQALRVAEEQIRQSQKMEAVGQLAGGIAHDFNNLLTVILGYTEVLLRGALEPDVLGDLEEIRNAGLRAGSLTAQLLAFSRKQVLDPQTLDLNGVVLEVERLLRRVIGEDIHFEVVMDPGLMPVKADPGQIHQILMNLAINARDAMPQGGRLRIATANAEDSQNAAHPMRKRCVSLTVSDTGCGMSRDVQDRIFEPFFTTKAVGKGTGLGLSVVYGVVTDSGGRISVESERNQGTTFVIYLPATEGAPVDEAPKAHEDLRGTQTVLLVEDEKAIRDLVRKVLAGYGYTVIEAADVADAIDIAERHPAPIHLLLSDIVMPDMSGPDLAQRVVALRRDIRVLYMSGFTNRLGTSLGTMSPGVALLRKPFTPERLGLKVRECLNQPQTPDRPGPDRVGEVYQ